MADSSGRSAGMPSTAGPSSSDGAKPKGKKVQGGRVVESRYLQYEKKANKKTLTADPLKLGGKMPEGGRRAALLQKSKADGSGIGKGDLQSTLLDGHGTAPPDLDLSAINDKSLVRKMPQLEKTMSKKPESTSFSSPRKKSLIENSLAAFEEKAEKNLLIVCREKEALQQKAHELRRRLLLCQRTRELGSLLDAQMEMLGPFEAVAECFKQQYKTFATALDTTRHELPVRSIHLEAGGQQLLDALQPELMATQRLLGELGVSSEGENGQVLDLLSELKDAALRKDLELRRLFAQVLELSAEASKEAALINQEVWEEVQGPATPSHWYFGPDSGISGDPRGEPRSTGLSGDAPHAR